MNKLKSGCKHVIDGTINARAVCQQNTMATEIPVTVKITTLWPPATETAQTTTN